MPPERPPSTTPEPVDLLLVADWLLPMRSDGGAERPAGEPDPEADVIPDGAIAIRAGEIVAVGPAGSLQARYRPDRQQSFPGHVLLPGLVNAHGHAAMSLLRGAGEDAPLQVWLTEHIWPLEGRWVDEQFTRDGLRLAMAEMIRAGITTFADMYYFPEIGAQEARRAGLRAQIAFPVIEFPNAWSHSSDEGFHKGLALYDQYRDDPFIDIAFGPHAPYTVTPADLERILMYSEELDANVHIHLHENGPELHENEARYGTSGIRHLHAVGLLGPRLQAVHMTRIDPEELTLCAETRVNVVHCPTSNAKLASGTCPVTALREAGVTVGLGTDGAASNNALDILAEARLASLLAKLSTGNAAALAAPEALAMATRTGAEALGRGSQTGSLEPGKAADVIAVDLGGIRHQPVYDPRAQLLHTAAGTSVTHVWVGGECLLENGHLTRLDEVEILASARAWQQRISSA